jgi:hypothetical protein
MARFLSLAPGRAFRPNASSLFSPQIARKN